jgi:putative CocE/NonD family hydrolase
MQPRTRPLTRRLTRLAVVATAALALTGTVAGTATTAAATPTRTATTASTTTASTPVATPQHWTPRPEQYAGTASVKDLAIPMSDGVVLRGDLTLPAGADGQAAPGRFPVVVTITAYNKTVIAGGFGSTLAGADPAYLVKRGYAQLTVDARGTGSSEGSWCAFCAREDQDAAEVMAWAHEQPWSNGSTAMTGASYMGISQIFAAAGKPAGLKAIFPQVPGADVYRDVVASGGQLDVGFMPLWLGLVTVTGLIPPAVLATDPQSGFDALATHLLDAATFTAPLLAEAAGGADPATYDGPFYAERSPINVVDKVDVPTFLISGEYDLFQRGTPLLFEKLRERGVPTKLIIGPWDHLQGSSGAQVGDAGYGSLAELQLRWFDHYVKGMPDPSLDSDIAPLTYYEQGTGRWQTSQDWVGRDRRAQSFTLSATSPTGGSLGTGTPTSGSATVLPVPVSGLCTRSANQWTAGIMNQLPFPNPCLADNQLNDQTGVVFDSAPVTSPVRFQGPINARLYTSVLGLDGDGMLSVSVEDVAPDGTVSRLTGGWQVVSLRQLDPSRSRYLDGTLIQPFHPFTKESQQPLTGTAPIDVEVFPTGASIEPGHRLRLAVQAFDVPHLAPNLSLLPGSLSALTIHTGPDAPSVLTVPAVVPLPTPASAAAPTSVQLGPAPRVRTSRTVVSLRRPARRHHAVKVAATVTCATEPAAGRVVFRWDGHRVAVRVLRDGRAVARVPARWVQPGRHRLVARYTGAADVAPSRAVSGVRVR